METILSRFSLRNEQTVKHTGWRTPTLPTKRADVPSGLTRREFTKFEGEDTYSGGDDLITIKYPCQVQNRKLRAIEIPAAWV